MLIIWDYFGVIAQDHFWYTAERLAEGHGMSADIKDAQHKSDLGLISWEDYCKEVANDIDIPLEAIVERYQHHQINQNVIRAVKHLDAHTHVLLSNASHQYLLPIMDRLGLTNIFSNTFVSSNIGYAKPDPRAYQYVLSEMGFAPENAVMIDDSIHNVDAARELGMKGLVFDSSYDADKLLSELVI